MDDADVDRQREGEIERQRSELGQLKERLALMCRQVLLRSDARTTINNISHARDANRQKKKHKTHVCSLRSARSRSS